MDAEVAILGTLALSAIAAPISRFLFGTRSGMPASVGGNDVRSVDVLVSGSVLTLDADVCFGSELLREFASFSSPGQDPVRLPGSIGALREYMRVYTGERATGPATGSATLACEALELARFLSDSHAMRKLLETAIDSWQPEPIAQEPIAAEQDVLGQDGEDGSDSDSLHLWQGNRRFVSFEALQNLVIDANKALSTTIEAANEIFDLVRARNDSRLAHFSGHAGVAMPATQWTRWDRLELTLVREQLRCGPRVPASDMLTKCLSRGDYDANFEHVPYDQGTNPIVCRNMLLLTPRYESAWAYDLSQMDGLIGRVLLRTKPIALVDPPQTVVYPQGVSELYICDQFGYRRGSDIPTIGGSRINALRGTLEIRNTLRVLYMEVEHPDVFARISGAAFHQIVAALTNLTSLTIVGNGHFSYNGHSAPQEAGRVAHCSDLIDAASILGLTSLKGLSVVLPGDNWIMSANREPTYRINPYWIQPIAPQTLEWFRRFFARVCLSLRNLVYLNLAPNVLVFFFEQYLAFGRDLSAACPGLHNQWRWGFTFGIREAVTPPIANSGVFVLAHEAPRPTIHRPLTMTDEYSSMLTSMAQETLPLTPDKKRSFMEKMLTTESCGWSKRLDVHG